MSQDDFSRVMANMSKYDRDRFREEVVEYERRARHQLEHEIIERLEYERQRMMRPPPSSYWDSPAMPSGLIAAFGSDYEAKPKPPTVDPAKLSALKDAEPYRVTQRMPDLMEVMTAWRAWAVTMEKGGLRLKALGMSHVWQPKQMVDAACTKGKHPAPQMDCECGVWAFKELDGLTSALNKYSEVKVLGNVQLWGRVIETENGYRAEKAYPSELWILDESLEELGLIYDVPVRMIRS